MRYVQATFAVDDADEGLFQMCLDEFTNDAELGEEERDPALLLKAGDIVQGVYVQEAEDTSRVDLEGERVVVAHLRQHRHNSEQCRLCRQDKWWLERCNSLAAEQYQKGITEGIRRVAEG